MSGERGEGEGGPERGADLERARLEAGRAALRLEAAALEEAAAALDGRFAAAVGALIGCRGKVCCAGLGKTGLVMRKVAATLASTGTPAVFLHAAEALHGDLGALQAGDLLLVASHSGQTAETAELAARARALGAPVVAICRDPGSRLGQAADLCLPLRVAREACPLDLAPTASTTALMALGDALAVALMRERGFGAAGFAALHPGGSLGISLRPVAERMVAAPLVGEDDPAEALPAAISAGGLGIVGVVAGGRLVGCVTDGDLRRRLLRGALQGRAADLMARDPACVGSDLTLREARTLMHARRITSVFVVAGGTADGTAGGGGIGLLHIHHLAGI